MLTTCPALNSFCVVVTHNTYIASSVVKMLYSLYLWHVMAVVIIIVIFNSHDIRIILIFSISPSTNAYLNSFPLLLSNYVIRYLIFSLNWLILMMTYPHTSLGLSVFVYSFHSKYTLYHACMYNDNICKATKSSGNTDIEVNPRTLDSYLPTKREARHL